VDNKHLICFDKCDECGKCSKACDSKALKIIGKVMTVNDVIDEILKDKKFYDNSSGGVTISGGEPMMQHDFLTELLKKIKAYRIHTAIETSGYAKLENFIKILPYVDLFLWDYKESDRNRHKKFTGVGNEKILNNLENLHDLGAKIILRCPIIPGINDRNEHFRNIAKITRRLKNIVGAEIMPYHHYGVNKSENMGMQTQDDYGIVSENQKLSWINKIESYGGKVIKE
jgi:pyruvate formate lyase activating enzyme